MLCIVRLCNVSLILFFIYESVVFLFLFCVIQLTIIQQTSGDGVGCRRQAKALHYKVLDKTVNLFPIGTSVAVL